MLVPSFLKTAPAAVWRFGTYALAQALNLKPNTLLYIGVELYYGFGYELYTLLYGS